MKNKLYGIMVVVALVASGLGFWGGVTYSQNQRASAIGRFQRNGSNASGTARGGNAINGGRPISGEVKAMDDKSITVSMPDGSSRFVFFSSSTTFQAMTETNSAAIKVGARINAMGKLNSDGSVTADTIQIR